MQTPAFWSKETSLLSSLLLPVGMLYGWATRRRLARALEYRAPIPVICVGNVTAGGSGKTPTVQALAGAALERGIAVHCLTRGHGGRLIGPVLVDPIRHDASDVGDEALLLAAIAPTWVARDRAAGARAAVAAGAQLLLLDDGLQNPALAYDLSLLVIDGGFGFGNGRLIPAGPLREPVQAVLSRVAAAILIGEDAKGSLAGLGNLTVTHGAIVPRAHDLAGSKVVAFAGLGRPQKFHDTLTAIGAEIVGWFPFPDHHAFTAVDLDALSQAAAATGGSLVTTEKDFVRLPQSFRDRVTVLAIDLVPEDNKAWDTLLDRVIPSPSGRGLG